MGVLFKGYPPPPFCVFLSKTVNREPPLWRFSVSFRVRFPIHPPCQWCSPPLGATATSAAAISAAAFAAQPGATNCHCAPLPCPSPWACPTALLPLPPKPCGAHLRITTAPPPDELGASPHEGCCAPPPVEIYRMASFRGILEQPQN